MYRRSSENNSNSKLIRCSTQIKKNWIEQFNTQHSLRKASSVNSPIFLSTILQSVDPDKVTNNPFIRAKLKVYLKKLRSTSIPSERLESISQSPEQKDNFKNDESITFRRLNSLQQESKQQIIQQLVKLLRKTSDIQEKVEV